MQLFHHFGYLIVALSVWMTTIESLQAAELYVGAATVSITPEKPVALWGQMSTRISQGVDSPVTATVLALESRAGEKSLEKTVLVSCDLVMIPNEVIARVRASVGKQLPDFPVNKILLNATHTHTAPVMVEGVYNIPAEGPISVKDYNDFFVAQVSSAILAAWKQRERGVASWGLGYAAVPQNRRAVFENGTATMYGRTNQPTFRMFEGYEDHGVEVLFFWNSSNRLLATAINVACPSQEVESLSRVNADFWHEVRVKLRAAHGENLQILGWTGASGDQSPHTMFRKQAEERMLKLRGVNRMTELANRIVAAWNEVYDSAKKDQHADVPLIHHVEELTLPRREVNERDYKLAIEGAAAAAREKGREAQVYWFNGVVKRYEAQQAGEVKPFTTEIHVIRLGDIAIASNQFELYTDFGIQLKARSPSLQTFVIQLAGPGTYLATQRAIEGGGYSAVTASNVVNAEAGQILVEKSLERIQAFWTDAPK